MNCRRFRSQFFDPDDGSYHTLTEPSVPLAVRSAGATPVPTIAATKTASAGKSSRRRTFCPSRRPGRARAKPVRRLVTRPAFLAVQALPVLAFLAAFVWRKRTDSLANNPRLRRQRAGCRN